MGEKGCISRGWEMGGLSSGLHLPLHCWLSISWASPGIACWTGLCPAPQRSPLLLAVVLEEWAHYTFYLNCPLTWFSCCYLQLNLWKSSSTSGLPVDVLVPSVSLQPVKFFLQSQGLDYSVTIEDLQVGEPRPLTCPA